MDGNEKSGVESCGIPVQGRESLSIGLGAGRTVGAYDADDKTKVYWCRCSDQLQCAFQDLALRLAAAKERANAWGDREKASRSARVRYMQREQNTVGETPPVDDRNTERRGNPELPT